MLEFLLQLEAPLPHAAPAHTQKAVAHHLALQMLIRNFDQLIESVVLMSPHKCRFLHPQREVGWAFEPSSFV